MTWKHSGKTSAFDFLKLDDNLIREYSISCEVKKSLNKKVHITRQAILMLSSLNPFDQKKVLNEIKYISDNPNSCSSSKHSRVPFKRLYRSKDQFQSYHYLIDFKLTLDDQVVIYDIYFDRTITGSKVRNSKERNVLYEVKRSGKPFRGALDSGDLQETVASWDTSLTPTHNISTEHAAVNGMQNNLEKATWLMGTHLDVAYPEDGFSVYTLFHNPTDRMLYDVIECIFDKRKGTKSQNAQHLAAILYQNQKLGRRVKWVVHSQGAIIFTAALEEYRKAHTANLTSQHLAVHAPGAFIPRLINSAKKLGITVDEPRSNPFDLVPNMAGRNDLSPSSLVRSLKFMGLTFLGTELTSPHTLPFLGLELYHTQLRLSGNHRRAQDVLNHINKYT